MPFIKKLPIDYFTRPSLCYNDVFLWHGDNVFVMDNHKSALWCWMQMCNPNEQYNFMHIDKHYDMLDCYKSADLVKLYPTMSFDEYCSAERDDGYKLMRWDNFIRAGFEKFPQWFNSAIFVTQKVGDIGTWRKNKLRFQEECPMDMNWVVGQYIEETSEGLSGITDGCADKKWIVSFDLDVFFSSCDDKVLIFSDEYIRLIARKLQRAMSNIQVLTIAISPDCLPGVGEDDLYANWQQGIRILKLMSEEIPAMRELIQQANW